MPPGGLLLGPSASEVCAKGVEGVCFHGGLPPGVWLKEGVYLQGVCLRVVTTPGTDI